MPELPEVETSLRGIQPHIEHQMITRVIIRQHQLRWKIPHTLPKKIQGKIIRRVIRRGKYLLLMMDDSSLILHWEFRKFAHSHTKNTRTKT